MVGVGWRITLAPAADEVCIDRRDAGGEVFEHPPPTSYPMLDLLILSILIGFVLPAHSHL